MAGGGQKGSSFIGEAGAAFLALGVIFGWAGRGCVEGSRPDAPMDKADDECEEAWREANDGEKDDEVPVIYNEPWCQQHNAAERQVREMEQQQEVQEQIEQVQEAQTP